MAGVDLVVGTPAWDRAWSLDLWFASVRANVDPERTGLVFVIPASDTATREAVARLSWGFGWVEVLRDQGEQSGREERPATAHRTLAVARNQILQVVNRVRPTRFVSWDTDFLVPARTVEALTDKSLPLATVWTWLNRQRPDKIRHFDGKEYHEVHWQKPVRASAMAWDPRWPGRAVHYPAHEFERRATRTWECGVALAFQVMDARAYQVASYSPHHDGEDVTFNWQLERRGIPRYCVGEVQGVHLYDRRAKDEIQMGWPGVMQLAKQVPLASTWTGPRTAQQEAFGFFPVRSTDAASPVHPASADAA